MRKWKCVATAFSNWTIGKIYKTDDFGCNFVDDEGEKRCGLIYNYIHAKFEEVKDFSLSDLKTGHRVTLRDGSKMIVMRNMEHVYDEIKDGMVSLNFISWNNFENYNEDLTNKYYKKLDIMKVEVLGHINSFIRDFNSGIKPKTIYERIEKSERDLKVESLQSKLDMLNKKHEEDIKAIQKEMEELK